MKIKLNVVTLVDSGSSGSFIHPDIVKSNNLKLHPAGGEVSMASTSHAANVTACVFVDISIGEMNYYNIKLLVLPGL